jgi:uncharacterized membrane protein YphA (DoxX/SURF4 family)
MKELREFYDRTDQKISSFMSRYGSFFLRISLGIIFFWFGFLKFFSGLSPATDIATKTIETLTFGLVQPGTSIIILATWEILIGLGLISGRFLRITLFLLFTQMLGTMTPLFLFTTETFTRLPYAPTLEGQYIIKNLVLISAGLVIGTTVGGGDSIKKTRNNPSNRNTES